MDNWGTEEKKRKGIDTTMKILIAIIVFVVIIIAIVIALLYSLTSNAFKVAVDGKTVSTSDNFLISSNEETYVDIQELAGFLGYQYHPGEYKVFSSDEDKCYVQSDKETASFYLNSDKICKLKVGELSEDYDVFNCENNIIEYNNKFYAPLDAAEIAFNSQIQLTERQMSITTLNTLLSTIDKQLNTDQENPIYNSILESEFDNQKAVLYNYIIASKTDSGLYSVQTTSGQEIIPDKYKSITFLEPTKEFLVTNSLDKMGIIDEDGQNKVDQLYDSIKVIGSNPKLYLVELNEKFGVIDEEGNAIIHVEYDGVGIDATKYTDLQNQYILLDTVIPVCKDNKYGLFDIDGNKLLDVTYDGIGCELTSVEVNGTMKSVTPVATIEDCEGIIMKTGEVYDLFLAGETELVPLKVSSVYYIKENGKTNYYMIYKEEELNLIERLVKAGVIEEPNENEETNGGYNTNTLSNNAIENFNVNQSAPQIDNDVIE